MTDMIPAQTQVNDDMWAEFEASQAVEDVPARRLRLTPASHIAPRPVRWLWDTTPAGEAPTSHGRLPMASLSIAAGGPGLGKSQFGVWLTANITRGTLPGELFGQPRGVIYAATEDSWSMTIAPRLIAAGADMDRVYRVDVEDDGSRAARLSLPVDTSMIGQAATDYGISLLVADPLLSMIDSTINDYRAAEVRAALEPLVAAADRHNFAVLGLAHFTKSTASADPLDRVAGSGAFGQLIRALIAFARGEADDGSSEYVMSLAKNNLGRLDLPSHSYTIQPVTVETSEGPAYTSRFVLGEEALTSVREIMGDEAEGIRGGGSDALQWLRGYMHDMGGSAFRRDVIAAGKKEGHSERTIDRNRKKLGLKSESVGFGPDRTSQWYTPEAWQRSH